MNPKGLAVTCFESMKKLLSTPRCMGMQPDLLIILVM